MAKRRYKGCELTSPLYRKVAAEMARNKNIIKELTEYLNEFNLTEIEYTEKDVKVKVSKSSGANLTTVKEIKSEIKSAMISLNIFCKFSIMKNI